MWCNQKERALPNNRHPRCWTDTSSTPQPQVPASMSERRLHGAKTQNLKQFAALPSDSIIHPSLKTQLRPCLPNSDFSFKITQRHIIRSRKHLCQNCSGRTTLRHHRFTTPKTDRSSAPCPSDFRWYSHRLTQQPSFYS